MASVRKPVTKFYEKTAIELTLDLREGRISAVELLEQYWQVNAP